MTARRKQPKVGERCRVWWWDYCNHTNALLSDAKPSKCWTEGQLVKQTKHYIVLATSLYTNDKGEPEDGEQSGDFTVIIRGGIEAIEIL